MTQLPTAPRSTPYRVDFDAAAEVSRVAEALGGLVPGLLRRRGVVVTMGGDIDSAVCASLAVRALGASNVLGLMLPERESSSAGFLLAVRWAEQLGIAYEVQDITSVLEVLSSYRHRDDAIRQIVPDFGAGWRLRRVLSPERFEVDLPESSTLCVADAAGHEHRVPLPAEVYRQIVAAIALKQRIRAVLEYYHADCHRYAVLATTDRLGQELGLFVKGGDGLADVKPLAHLYRAEVRQMGRALGVPPAILERPSTADYSRTLQEADWPLSLPPDVMDGVLHAWDIGQDAEMTARLLSLGREEVEVAFGEIQRRRADSTYLHEPPLLVKAAAPASPRPPDAEP